MPAPGKSSNTLNPNTGRTETRGLAFHPRLPLLTLFPHHAGGFARSISLINAVASMYDNTGVVTIIIRYPGIAHSSH